ncbi:MAG TPA: hypothetical protein ENN05_10400 [Deltaproteobacteria bacterium]|nr:hypothetical protein [Deltaproteobacteria bacterium]
MRNRQVSIGVTIFLLAIVFSGCTSMRYTSTLKPSADRSLQFGSARFTIAAFTYEKPGIQPIPPVIDQKAMILYPDIFTNDRTALPVHVDIKRTYDDFSYQVSAFLTGFCTLTMLPFPGTQKHGFTVNAKVMDSMGEILLEKETCFEVNKVLWSCALPLGLLPVPGPSDLPRDYVFFTTHLNEGDDSFTKVNNYAAECIVEAVARSIGSAERARLEAAYLQRQSSIQEIIVDGRKCWGFLALTNLARPQPGSTFSLFVYQDHPSRTVKTIDQAIVARLDEAGRWQPVNGYLRHSLSLTSVSALMENNVPVKAVVRTPDVPPIEDFIDTPDLSGADRAEVLRWSNAVLLDAKNRSMDRVFRDETRDTLLRLATRIESSILELSEQSERAKDRAQAKVQKGEGDPAPDRELSILCRQRMEVLKPILAAIKQEAAVRQ